VILNESQALRQRAATFHKKQASLLDRKGKLADDRGLILNGCVLMNELLPLILFCIATSFTPGPNNILILNSGLHFGIKKSLPHFIGICVGFPLMILIVALGFGAVLTEYPWIKDFFKFAGAAYMLYLSWQILNASTNIDENQKTKPMTFLQAVLFQWVNGKAWVIAVGGISLFTLSENYILNAFAVSGFFLSIGVFTVGVWLVGGALLKHILKNENQIRWFNRIMAASLAASIALLFVM